MAQIGFQFGADGRRRLHGWIEEAQGVAALCLGLVHGEIGALQQFVLGGWLVVEECDADTRCAVVHILGQQEG